MINRFGNLFLSILIPSLSFGLSPRMAWAGGGSIVGNGAGLVENNFAYVYTTLANTYGECLHFNNCQLEPLEVQQLRTIQAALLANPTAENNLVFVSEKEKPGFFDTAIGQEHRIAKTCLHSRCPIFVNSDALYGPDGTPAIDIGTIASLLTHELGHQSGEPDHLKLDLLGAKIKRAFQMKVSSHRLPLGSNSGFIVTLINQKFPQLTADLFLGLEGQAPKNVTSEVIQQVPCSNGASLSGIEIFNGHYTGFDKNFGNHELIKFGFWLNLSCFESVLREIHTETHDVEIMISKDLIPLVIKNNLIEF